MTLEEENLIITMEECGELTQACSKVIRTEGMKEKYLQNLKDEVGDIMACISLLKAHGFVTEEEINERVSYKINKVRKWSTNDVCNKL